MSEIPTDHPATGENPGLTESENQALRESRPRTLVAPDGVVNIAELNEQLMGIVNGQVGDIEDGNSSPVAEISPDSMTAQRRSTTNLPPSPQILTDVSRFSSNGRPKPDKSSKDKGGPECSEDEE